MQSCRVERLFASSWTVVVHLALQVQGGGTREQRDFFWEFFLDFSVVEVVQENFYAKLKMSFLYP